jgi:hypothetical protein
MSATRREPSRSIPQTRTRRVVFLSRGRLVNWSNKASPQQWRARRRARGRR